MGDPPVSPAVMAGNFLDDINVFLSELSTIEPESDCSFHQHAQINADDAAYHDMADLFGFKTKTNPYQYECPLSKKHTHSDCLMHLSEHINCFFDGEHPTRKSYYEYMAIQESIQPARTIYTGNYVFNPQGLYFFIPFSHLKLRMAGPTLGRLIKATIGERFISANLPMLHKRTIDTSKQAEFRAGIKHQQKTVDISHEFVRQFYGDVMLFSIQELTQLHYPDKPLNSKTVRNIVLSTYKSIRDKYQSKHLTTVIKINTLEKLLEDKGNWWSSNSEFKAHMQIFIDNMQLNFGEYASAYEKIDKADAMLADIIESIRNYPEAITQWNQSLKLKQ